MLPERFRELLTAYVDGELSTRQRKHVLRLLQQSAEARTLLRQLQEDASRLRALPKQHIPRDVSSQVVQTIIERKLELRNRRLARVPPLYFPAWTGLAAAAAVLFVIGLASYVYFAQSQMLQSGDSVASGEQPATVAREESKPPAEPAPELPDPKVAVTTPEPKPTPPEPPQVVEKPREQPPDAPPAEQNTELANPLPNMDMFKPRTADVPLPVLLKLRELDAALARQALKDKVHKDRPYRLELLCRETVKGFERIQAAFKANGVGLLIDQTAQTRLKRSLKTNYVFYAEDLTVEELAGVLARLGGDDKAAEAKRPGDGQFNTVVINQMTRDDHKELTELMGADPTQTPPAKSGTPLGVDPRKPVSESTADQVTQTLKGQGGTPRPEPGKPAVKAPEHWALAMTFNPARPFKPDVKRFLDSRKPARPGTVQVLLVLRGV